MTRRKKIVVALSGGVDSSIAAYLMKEAGHEVIALFMKNWHDDSVTISRECPWLDDSNDAMIVAQQLGIPFQTVDLSEVYKKRIVDYMFAEYERGRTPNPDILCNREIKFDVFLKMALRLDADFVATGHYARKDEITGGEKPLYRLLAGTDPNKDQSYFLCQLTQQQLARAVFPIGEMTKPQVRALARKIGLPTADKKDSQGLCFVGKVHLPDFLQQQLKPRTGKVIEIPSDLPLYANGHSDTTPYAYHPGLGKVVGEHRGAHYYTIGQRKGLNLGGNPKPLFVIGNDTINNILYMGQGEDHPGLYRKGLYIPAQDVHWVRPDRALQPGEQEHLAARIRYRQSREACTLVCREDGLSILFDRPQKSITPGQFAAWYDGEELIGSGVIAS